MTSSWRKAHIAERQRVLRTMIDYEPHFDLWEESCVPSYCHSNRLAAHVSWSRLFAAVDLARKTAPRISRVLDFGSSTGELGHLLPQSVAYDFVEDHDAAATLLIHQLPRSSRKTLEEAPTRAYDVVFAIDSLEHNSNYPQLLEVLVGKLGHGGVLILCGPTENWLYRVGRMIAGFNGQYHETNIRRIEDYAACLLRRCATKIIFPLAPLFRVTAWTVKRASGNGNDR